MSARRRRLVAPHAVHAETGTLVFAFGSNLREEQMRARCPSARAVEVGLLAGHSLAFVGFSRGWGGAVATVVPAEHDAVDGVVYRISNDDLLRLDAFEGAPHVYERKACAIKGAKLTYRAWVYAHQRPFPGAPSYRYLAAIVEGRVRAGLDAEPIVQAAEASAACPPF